MLGKILNIPYSLGIITLLALPLAACNDTTANAAAPVQALTEVRYTVVQSEDIPIVHQMPGRISAQKVAEVRPQVNGIIKERLFEEGSDVKAGQVLYQIDPEVYQAAYNSALASLKQAEANEVSARLLAERYSVLVSTAAVSKQEHDDAVAAMKQTAAAVEVAKAALESARINLDYTKVTSPVDGRIGRSFVTEGALVTQNQATPLATVQQLNPVHVDLSMSSAEMIRMRKAMASGEYLMEGEGEVRVSLSLEDGSKYSRLDDPEQPIIGSLMFRDVTVEQSTGTVTLRVKIDNPDNILLPGMYVHAELEGGLDKGRLLAPQRAVQRDSRGSYTAFVLLPQNSADASGYVVEQRPLNIERNYGNFWVVGSGIEAGELLLVDGLQKVRTGQLVSAVEIGNQGQNELAQKR